MGKDNTEKKERVLTDAEKDAPYNSYLIII